MTDLLELLPNFPVRQYGSLMPSITRHGLATSDLLTLDVADIKKRTRLPLLNLERLCKAVLDALHDDLGVSATATASASASASAAAPRPLLPPGDHGNAAAGDTAAGDSKISVPNPHAALTTPRISTLDPVLDAALGGGIPAGYVTEITGESGAGKTQLLLTLLCAVQLPPPRGLGRSALYVSTEGAPLTMLGGRMGQIIAANPELRAVGVEGGDGHGKAKAGDAAERGGPGLGRRIRAGPPPPSPLLDGITAISTPDLESQDHILSFQVPVQIERRNVGLLVIDSVAANYRAEFERNQQSNQQQQQQKQQQQQAGNANTSRSSNLGARSADLVRLGMHLRELARKHGLAVVVANQVADRFDGAPAGLKMPPPPSSLSSSSSSSTPLVAGAATALLIRSNSNSQAGHRIGPAAALSQQHHHQDNSPLAVRSVRNGQALPLAPAHIEPSSSAANVLPRSSVGGGAADNNDGQEEEEEMPPPPPPQPPPMDDMAAKGPPPVALLLDHQQNWFTGWGDDPSPPIGPGADMGSWSGLALKTPSLGLVWSTQIAMRVALLRRPTFGPPGQGGSGEKEKEEEEEMGEGDKIRLRSTQTFRFAQQRQHQQHQQQTWRRWMKVVFAPDAPAAGPGLEGAAEFEVTAAGLKGGGG